MKKVILARLQHDQTQSGIRLCGDLYSGYGTSCRAPWLTFVDASRRHSPRRFGGEVQPPVDRFIHSVGGRLSKGPLRGPTPNSQVERFVTMRHGRRVPRTIGPPENVWDHVWSRLLRGVGVHMGVPRQVPDLNNLLGVRVVVVVHGRGDTTILLDRGVHNQHRTLHNTRGKHITGERVKVRLCVRSNARATTNRRRYERRGRQTGTEQKWLLPAVFH